LTIFLFLILILIIHRVTVT